jgi:hypothetical protein
MKIATASLAIGLALLGGMPPAAAQPKLQTNEPVFKSGNWFVVRSTKEGRDTVACTGFYKAHRGIQLSEDSLIVRIPDDMQEITIGYGDKMRPPRPPEDIEKDLRAVVFRGADFDRLRRTRTVKLEIATAKGTVRHEMNVQGINAALLNIASGCPVPAERVMAQPQPGGAADAVCPPALMARMRANGVNEAQIAASCR